MSEEVKFQVHRLITCDTAVVKIPMMPIQDIEVILKKFGYDDLELSGDETNGWQIDFWYKVSRCKSSELNSIRKFTLRRFSNNKTMTDFCNHSGGCQGADLEWDAIGRAYGFENHKHYRPADLIALLDDVRAKLESDVLHAAITLQRPTGEFKGKDLVRRNWFQAYMADAVYAVSRIVEPGGLDKGFVNNNGRQIVAGGTAWACEIGINKGKPVYVFDMNSNYWYLWNPETKEYDHVDTPILTKQYAGIGSRMLNNEARQAIRDVYVKTIKHETLKNSGSDTVHLQGGL